MIRYLSIESGLQSDNTHVVDIVHKEIVELDGIRLGISEWGIVVNALRGGGPQTGFYT